MLAASPFVSFDGSGRMTNTLVTYSAQVATEHHRRASFYASKAQECGRLSEMTVDVKVLEHWLELATEQSDLVRHQLDI